jgi:hypothetical protein
MMFRALWIWQRWIGVWRPKLRRIALASAFEPSRAVDPERRHQHEVLADVDAVDLHHHDVECR